MNLIRVEVSNACVSRGKNGRHYGCREGKGWRGTVSGGRGSFDRHCGWKER